MSAAQLPVIHPAVRAQIAENLLIWYDQNKRALPWRGAEPYAVWVSEIMLQQTQVATALPFYDRFMKRFPSLQSLADAPQEDVLSHWAGLGYYARARNLHRAAQMVMQQHGGMVPNTAEALEALPGIGRYTSGAILSAAYNQQRPIVDTNVIRVLCRVFELKGDPRSAQNQKMLWSFAEQLVPVERPGEFNQAVMELGATVCNIDEPQCEKCPILRYCTAGNSADPSALPEYPPNRPAVNVTHSAAILKNVYDHYLIIQRPEHGLWGGLWEFPRVICEPGEPEIQAAARAVEEYLGVKPKIGKRLAKIKHTVTHHRITLYGYFAQLDSSLLMDTVIEEKQSCRWVTLADMRKMPFSSPQAILREHLIQSQYLEVESLCTEHVDKHR